MEHFVNASLSRGRKKCVNVSVSVCVRVHMWAWLPFGTRWPSNWPCPHSHRPTRTDPAGLNARNTPACQSNPRGGWHSPERACINIQRMCVRVYRPRPWWPPATPFHSAAVRRDLETRDCYYSPADSTHTHTHTHTHTTHTHTQTNAHTQTAEQLGTLSTTAARHEYSSMARRWILAEIPTRRIKIQTLMETSEALTSPNAWAVKHVWPCANRVSFDLQRGQATAPYSWNFWVDLKNVRKSQLFPNEEQN